MKKAKARFTPEAARIIAALPPEIKRLVCASIDELLINPESGSALTGEPEGYRSLKAKRYRIVYRVNDAGMTIEVLLVGHRRDVYDTVRSLIIHREQEND